MSLTHGQLRLIDSLNLLNMSLDTIVKALGTNEKSPQEIFTHTKKSVWR